MGIVDEDVQKVRAATDIVAIISLRVQLRRVGQRWVGLCPFHGEKTPSFSVNSTENFYYCFGCRQSGDVINFVRETEQLDFVGAVEWLAHKAGITLRYTDGSEGRDRKERQRLHDAVKTAADWYHERLLSAPDAGRARGYLRDRGFDRQMVERYQLGWAPDTWDEMCRATKLDAATADATGLGFVNRANRLQDFFRGRVLFPICDDQGRPIGFGGRILPGVEGAKYQNSRDNRLYHKSQVLYGLHWAKAAAVREGGVIVCEGYTDVIGFHRAGLENAVATCGTALTEDHLKVLVRFAPKVILAYDADSAGQAAAERVYEWERSLGIEIAVVALPEGSDPDEMSRNDPDELRHRVETAQPFLGFRVGRALRDIDISSPERRLRAAAPAVALVAEHPDGAIRRAYLDEIATRVRVDAGDLEPLLAAGSSGAEASSGGPKRSAGVSQLPAGAVLDDDGRVTMAAPPPGMARRRRERPGNRPLPLEVRAIAVCATRPEYLASFQSVLFRHPDAHAAYRALAESRSVAEALERLEGSARELIASALAGAAVSGDVWMAERESDPGDPNQIRHELVLLVAQAEVQRLGREAATADDVADIVAEIQWAASWIQKLREQVGDYDTSSAAEAADALVDWLSGDA